MTPLAHVGGPVLAPVQLGPIVIISVLYAIRVRKLARTPRAVPIWRQGCFFGGLALIVLTLASPIGHIADELFWVHMTEHLLIADIGALMLVLGTTGPLLAPLLRQPSLSWLRGFGHPLVALPLWTINFYVWHLPALYEAAIEHPWVHALEHFMFVGFGMAMWMALLGPLPKPSWFGNLARLLYIIAVRLIGTVLANVLVWDSEVLYRSYAEGERFWGISPQTDQVVAGSVMMVEGSIVTICLFCWLFLRAAKEGDERQELLDFAASRGVALDASRAGRAVAAGRGAELRQRIARKADDPD